MPEFRNPEVDNTLTSESHIQLYLSVLDKSIDGLNPVYDVSAAEIDYNAAATLFMNESKFRNTFKLKIPDENDPNGAYLFGVADPDAPGAANMVDPSHLTNAYYYINQI